MFALPIALLMLNAVADPAAQPAVSDPAKNKVEKVAAAAPADPTASLKEVADQPSSTATRSAEPRTTRLDRLESERRPARPR